MTAKADFILKEALSMSPAERARLAHKLISSLDQPQGKNDDAEWIELARKRLAEFERGNVETVSWKTVKQKVRE
jgi:putative addiction module component (TIGR02574 family)